MSVTVCLDLTRMSRRMGFAAATGIDRWDLEVARRLLAGVSGLHVLPIVQVGPHLRQLPWAGHLVTQAVNQWNDGQAPDQFFKRWAFLGRFGKAVPKGSVYLNLSHQGLERPALWDAITKSDLRTVVYIHDLIPHLHPETTRPEQPDRHRARLIHTLSRSQMILCPSQVVADDIKDFASTFRHPLPPLVRLPPGLQGRRAALPVDPATRRPLFLVLGTLEPRKAHTSLAPIWSLWTDPGARPDLHILGQPGWQGMSILDSLRASSSLHDRLTIRLGPSDTEVSKTLRRSTALLMPSSAEGWGLPVSEALSIGVPALVRDLPIYRESGQGLATTLPPPEHHSGEQAWHQALSALCANPKRVSGYRPMDWDTALSPLWNILRSSL